MVVEVGRELGRGIRSVVYALGDVDVIKVPNAGTPRAWLVEEHRNAESAERSGAPVPARRRLVDHDGGLALVSERIDGATSWERCRDDPGLADELGAELAAIQREVWSCVPSYEMSRQRDRIESKIHVAARRHGDDLLAALDVLPSDDGRPQVLCHGDLHPHNVLHSERGIVLVDWFDASRGSAAADVARTELILSTGRDLDPAVGPEMRLALDRMLACYRTAVRAPGDLDPDELARWTIVQAVARLAEGFGEDRVDEIRSALAKVRR